MICCGNLNSKELDRDVACSIAPVLRMLSSPDGMATVKFYPGNDVYDTAIAGCDSDKPIVVKPMLIEPDADIDVEFSSYVEKRGLAPQIVVVRGVGGYKISAVDTVFSSERLKGRLAGRIAVITGGAQGFGKGIAESLAAEGAYIVVADLNLEGATECVAELNRLHGDGAAIAVQVDVSDGASVENMIQETVLAFGGLDIMVSNAGILIAGSLEDMTKEHFELVTKVNYTGYFLCAKYASVPMKIQNKYSPGYMTDIIEINSKSGLEGSNKNFAYAGSKFGGVGLTQSFAMELVEYGIKVNAICPGNLLDGPLWSDPKKGLFRQYLDSGKVAGAKSIDDVRKFYEAKVPMGRGCTIPDVVRAILYVVEQKYETGQAIPVTGGQVMLK